MTRNLRDRRAHARRGAVATFLFLALAGAPPDARACDLCAIYVATDGAQSRTGWSAGVGQQFTRFGTLQLDGDRYHDGENEWMNSSITQFLVGYGLKPWLGLQLNVPFIVRDYRRVLDGDLRHGDESGFGDLSLIASVVPYRYVDIESVVRVSAFGGLKLPSGSSRKLAEEQRDHHDDGDDHDAPPGLALPGGPFFARHETGGNGTPSGLHGHDIALGSGSVDGILGAQLFASWRQLFVTGMIQYLLRTEGDFDYRYANDLIWRTGLGGFLATGHDLFGDLYSVSIQGMLSGETKGKDSVGGEKENDTGFTSLFMGPSLSMTWGTRLSFDLAGDLPLLRNNTGLQIVPDYRVRGGFVWRF
jgi:hypothetical protein